MSRAADSPPTHAGAPFCFSIAGVSKLHRNRLQAPVSQAPRKTQGKLNAQQSKYRPNTNQRLRCAVDSVWDCICVAGTYQCLCVHRIALGVVFSCVSTCCNENKECCDEAIIEECFLTLSSRAFTIQQKPKENSKGQGRCCCSVVLTVSVRMGK